MTIWVDKAKVLADLYPMTDAPSIDDTHYDIHKRQAFKVRDFLVIRWCEGNLLASPYFPFNGRMLVDWIRASTGSRQRTKLWMGR